MTDQLFRDNPYLQQCEARIVAVTAEGIHLDRTVFYPMGGGQPGDSGVLRLADGRQIVIADTRKGPTGEIMHIPETIPDLAVGELVTAQIDWERRYRHMRMHTCLHLLCAVVGAGVTGGSIGADRGRLDFDLPESTLDKQNITAALNRLIEDNHATDIRWITDAELDAQPELVKTLSVQPPRGQGQVRLVGIPAIDVQPCGGTHVANTGEIGPVQVIKIEKKSRHNRRVIVAFTE